MSGLRTIGSVAAALCASLLIADAPPQRAEKKTPAKPASTKSGDSSIPAPVARAMREFRADAIKSHMRFLSDDLLEGRAPGTRGDELATLYIASQLESYGLEPAGDDGTYFQRVSLLGIGTQPETTLSLVKDGESQDLRLLDDFVATDQTQSQSAAIDADLVFVGHGVVAPEYKWDDYKGVDVAGKLLVMLVDDPPATPQEPDLFKGKARTYYGRWTYKYEIALAKGAVGAILIHTDEAAGYPWDVVRNSWGKERAYVKLASGKPELKLAGWMTEPVAARLMTMAGQDLSRITSAGHRREFRPVPLGVRARGRMVSKVRNLETANVVAKLTGNDPARRDEAVLYTAHHDHLGIGKPENGDAIYNGAIDNASGVAIFLEMARVWAQSPPPPRSILFATVAAEEQGLLGSAYYADHPIVPPGKTAVALNFDGIEQFGKVQNITMLGVERTTFQPVAARVTRGLGVRIDPDEHPEQGSYYRSDHFSLAKLGIPSFSVNPGSEYVGQPKEFGEKVFQDYNRNRYHQPDDEFDENWDFSQGVQIAQLGYWLGWEGARMPELARWQSGDEFFAIRERSFAAAD
jgi:hypothetical protein